MQLSMGGPASALAHLSIWSFHSLSQRFNSTPFHYPTDPVCLTKRERERSFQFSSTQCSSWLQEQPSLLTFALPDARCSCLPSCCFLSEIQRKRGPNEESASFFLCPEVGFFLFVSFWKILLVCAWSDELSFLFFPFFVPNFVSS